MAKLKTKTKAKPKARPARIASRSQTGFAQEMASPPGAGLRGRILSGASYGAVAMLLGLVVNLAATPYFYRQLGVAAYAAFVLLTSAIAFAHLLSLGAHEAVLFFLAKPRSESWHRQAQALAALFTLGGALGALAWSLAWAGLPEVLAWTGHVEPETALALSQGLAAAGLLWLAQHFTQALWAFYRARLRLAEVGWMQIATACLPPLAAVAAVAAGAGLNGFFLVQAAAWGMVGVGAWMAAHRGPEGMKLSPRWHKAELAGSLSYVRWAFLLQLGFTLQSYADRFFAAPLGSESVAVYGLATSLTLRLVSALGLVSTLFIPAISKLHAEHGLGRAARAHGLGLRATFWFGAAFFVPLAVGGPTLLGRWVDPAMESLSQGWFAWACLGAFWMALVASLQGTLLGLGRPRVVTVTTFMGLCAGAGCAWGLRGHGLWAVASFGSVTAGVSLLLKAAWLHGRVLKQFAVGEFAASSALLALLAWALSAAQWPQRFGPSLAGCVLALAAASAAVLLAGALWDWGFSRGHDRDSLWSVVASRLKGRA
jgi:O-antigen/teichoic acid export membrane protein